MRNVGSLINGKVAAGKLARRRPGHQRARIAVVEGDERIAGPLAPVVVAAVGQRRVVEHVQLVGPAPRSPSAASPSPRRARRRGRRRPAPVAWGADRPAPGAPGQTANWTDGDKDGFGTATALASKVWFTLDDGELTEVY
jgi:Glucodextranase, domain N